MLNIFSPSYFIFSSKSGRAVALLLAVIHDGASVRWGCYMLLWDGLHCCSLYALVQELLKPFAIVP